MKERIQNSQLRAGFFVGAYNTGMERKSKLTEKQWSNIAARMLAGEPVRALAREFGLAESTIRQRLAAQTAQIKSVANQMVSVDAALKSMPMAAQVAAHSLADQLRAMSASLGSAGAKNADTAHRLASIANSQINKIDLGAPLESEGAMKAIAVLTRMSNDAATVPLALLALNKDALQSLDRPAVRLKPLTDSDFLG